jgi:ankyrin repeat protein
MGFFMFSVKQGQMPPPRICSFLLFLAIFLLPRIVSCQIPSSPNLTYDDFTARLTEAKAKQKPVLLFLGSEESAVSKKLDTDILSNPKESLKKSMDAYVLTRVNGNSPEGKQVETAYGWRQPPVLAIINSDGELFDTLDLSRMSEEVLNSSTADFLTTWLDKNGQRFQRYGVRGYEQTELSKTDPIHTTIDEWNHVKDKYKKSEMLVFLNDTHCNFDGKDTNRIRQHLITYIGKTDSITKYEVQVSLWQKSAKFKLISGRVITPDLKVNKLNPADVEENSGYLNYPQYDHVRNEKLLFPALKAGSIVESDWEIEEPSNMPGHSVYQFQISSLGVATLHAHAEFSSPSTSNPKAVVLRNSGVVTSKAENGRTTLTFDGHTEHIQSDKMPEDRDLVVPEEVVFATKNSWEEIGKYFLSLTQTGECRAHTPELDQWVDQALLGVDKGPGYERRAANAILKAMRQKFRYLSLQMSDTGYQPHPIAETFKFKCGDCKDLSLFLQEALNRARVKSDLVLINPLTYEPFDQEMPRCFFNHVILRIDSPEGTFFADPSGFQSAGVLPMSEYGKKALLCSDQKSEIITLPPLDQTAAGNDIDIKFKGITKNPTQAELKLTYTGMPKFAVLGSVRNNWNAAFDKHESSFLKMYFKDFEVTQSYKENDDLESDPLIIRINAKISGVVTKLEDSILVKPFFYPENHHQLPHRIEGRKNDERILIAGSVYAPITEVVSYPIMKGFIPPKLSDLHIDNPYFTVDRTCKATAQRISFTTKIITKPFIGPPRYVKESELPSDSRDLVNELTQPVTIKMDPGEMLRHACESNNRERVQELLKQGVSVESSDEKQRTPIMVAAEAGNTDIVKDLIAAKANIEAKNSDDQSPLIRAIRMNNTDAALALIEAGANINVEADRDSKTRPINYAAARGNLTLIKKLLDAGADLNSNSGEGTPVYLAAVYNKMDAVKFLLSKKPDLSLNPLSTPSKSKEEDWPTLLAMVVSSPHGTPEMLQLFLENGANPDAVDNTGGRTPLYFAAGWCKPEMIAVLIKNHASVDKPDSNGETPLMHSIQYNSLETTKALVEAGASINKADSHGATALDYAYSVGNLAVADYLKQKGATDTGKLTVFATPLPKLSPAQSWALCLPAIYFQEFAHPQLVLDRVKGIDRSTDQEKQMIKSTWNISDPSSLLSTLNTLEKGKSRKLLIEKARILSEMDDAKFANYISGPLVSDEIKRSTQALRDGYKKWGDKMGLAFDLVRYANLVCWGYRCGYITEDEAWKLLQPVARTVQKNFNSWQELGQNFVDGRTSWTKKDEEEKNNSLTKIVEMLSNPKDPNSPWNMIPWNTDLTGDFAATNKTTQPDPSGLINRPSTPASSNK